MNLVLMTITHLSTYSIAESADVALEMHEMLVSISKCRLLFLQVAFSYNLLDELLPLYASAPIRLGGLLLPANLLAVPLMTSGPVMMIFSIWVLPPIQRRFSILTTMRFSLLIAAPLVLVVRPIRCLSLAFKAASWSNLSNRALLA